MCSVDRLIGEQHYDSVTPGGSGVMLAPG